MFSYEVGLPGYQDLGFYNQTLWLILVLFLQDTRAKIFLLNKQQNLILASEQARLLGSYEVQLKKFCMAVRSSFLPAEKVNETSARHIRKLLTASYRGNKQICFSLLGFFF